jgi:hypothetical protein
MIRTKAKLDPFMLSLSKQERDESSISPFDKLRANGNMSHFAYHCYFLRTKGVGCTFEGWDIFCSGRFQAGKFDNQSRQRARSLAARDLSVGSHPQWLLRVYFLQ